MSKSIQDALDLPTLEDLLKAPRQVDDSEESSIDDFDFDKIPEQKVVVSANDHEIKTDEIYDETLQHARDLMDLGYNVDTRSAGRIFETAAGLYRTALEAKNSKRDAQLKAMKLELEHKKLEILLKGAKGNSAPGDTIEGEAVVLVENRNELLKQLRSSK